MSILCYSLFSVVFLGLPGLRFTGTGSVCGSVAAICAGASGTTSSGFTFFGRPGLLLGVSSTFTFFGLPGLRLGFVSTGFSFFGLPGLRFGVWSKSASVELSSSSKSSHSPSISSVSQVSASSGLAVARLSRAAIPAPTPSSASPFLQASSLD